MMLTNVSSILTTSPSNWRRVDLWAFRSALCCGECIDSGASVSARILTAVAGKGKKTTRASCQCQLSVVGCQRGKDPLARLTTDSSTLSHLFSDDLRFPRTFFHRGLCRVV